MYPDLYLIRHGQSVWNREGRLQGRFDSPLTETGRAQARALAPYVASLDAARLSSPQGRAVETARILFGEDFTTDTRLAEINIGDFAGRLTQDLLNDHPQIFDGDPLDWYDRAPGGEHFAGLAARVADFLDGLRQPAIIVTHGVTLRMLRVTAMGQPLDQIGALPLEQGSVHVIRSGLHETWRPDPARGLASAGVTR